MRWPTLEEYVIGAEIMVLSAVVLAGFVRVIPEGSQQPVMLIVGAFITHIGIFINWKWGSSAGSAAKDETIAAQLPTVPPPKPPPPPTPAPPAPSTGG